MVGSRCSADADGSSGNSARGAGSDDGVVSGFAARRDSRLRTAGLIDASLFALSRA